MNILTETEKAYLAGLIDGEGCIHISKETRPTTPTPVYNLRIVVVQADKEYLKHWHRKAGTGRLHKTKSIGKSLKPEYQDNCHECYTWNISSQDAAILLATIKEYLVLKKEQAEVALRFQSTMGRKLTDGRVSKGTLKFREECRQAIMSRNQREYQDAITEEPEEIGIAKLQISMF